MSFTEGGNFHELAESPRGGYVGLGNVHTGALRTDKQVPEAVSSIKRRMTKYLSLSFTS